MSLNLHPKHKSLHLCPYSGKWELIITKKRSSSCCQVSWCRNAPIHYLSGGKVKTKAYCSKCCLRRYRANHPINYAFHAIKDSAKKRNIPFSISFEDFSDWCTETGYAENKGVCRLKNHCDRIDDSKGYEKGNIQLLSERENIQKRNLDKLKQNQQIDENEPF